MATVPSAVVAATGLVGGHGVARWTKKRQLGGVVLAAAGSPPRSSGVPGPGARAAGALSAAYVAAFAGSHPLAKKVGAWPSVLGVAGAVALASWAVADRKADSGANASTSGATSSAGPPSFAEPPDPRLRLTRGPAQLTAGPR